MTDDRIIANLLGEAPHTPDPGFRLDVFLRIAEHARRRAALGNAARAIGLFAAIGLVFPILQALGVTWADAQPLALAAGVIALAYLFAALTIQGPGAVLARSRAMLHA
jgi:hypothetical protein